ncbi:hypothetical protein [Spongorhabdus nitratireducens]
MKYLKQAFISLFISLLGLNYVQARSFDITAYMGNAHVYIAISEQDSSASAGKSSVVESGSVICGAMAGHPSGLWSTDSPVYAFAYALDQAVKGLGLDPDAQEKHECRVFISAAGCRAVWDGKEWAPSSVSLDEKSLQKCPKAVAYTIPVMRGADKTGREKFFREVFTELLNGKGFIVKPGQMWLEGDQVILAQVLQYVASKNASRPVNNLDFLHVASCVTPYQIRDGKPPTALKRQDGRPGTHGGQWRIGQQLLDGCLKAKFGNCSDDDYELTVAGLTGENACLLKVMAKSEFAAKYYETEWVEAEKKKKHLLTYLAIGKKNETGQMVCSIAADGHAVCQKSTYESIVVSDSDICRAQCEAEAYITETIETLIKVVNGSFMPGAAVPDGNPPYTVPSGGDELPPILIAGELAWVLQDLDSRLKSETLQTRLDESKAKRIQLVNRKTFMDALPIAGRAEMDRRAALVR